MIKEQRDLEPGSRWADEIILHQTPWFLIPEESGSWRSGGVHEAAAGGEEEATGRGSFSERKAAELARCAPSAGQAGERGGRGCMRLIAVFVFVCLQMFVCVSFCMLWWLSLCVYTLVNYFKLVVYLYVCPFTCLCLYCLITYTVVRLNMFALFLCL